MNDPTLGGSIVFFLMTMVISLVIGLAVYIVSAIFMAKVFTKAGVEGNWRAWVPLYNMMVFFKLGDLSPWLVLYLFAGGMVLSLVGIGFIASLLMIAASMVAAYRVGQKLGAEPAMVALWIVAPVWLIVMGAGSSRWNPAVEAAPWQGNGLLEDRTSWDGIPDQSAMQAPRPVAGTPPPGQAAGPPPGQAAGPSAGI